LQTTEYTNGRYHHPSQGSKDEDAPGLQHPISEEINELRLLEVCHSFANFQKDSIESTSKYLKSVNVLVRTNPFAEFSNYLPTSRFERFKKSNKIDPSDKPENIKISPTPIWYLPMEKSYMALGEKHYKKVRRVVEKEKLAFDLIHAHFTWTAGYAGARLKEEYGIPFVVTAHGYDIYDLPFRNDEWRKRIEFVLNGADHIITVSNSNQVCIRKLDVSTPVTVIPNGYRADLFHPLDQSECRKILKLPTDKKIILTVGNLEPVKGQKYLIEALKEIDSKRKDVLLVIVGSGKLKKVLEQQIRSLGLEGNVILAGSKSHDEIPIWINASDVFVLSSLKEGNPTVMFESLGCGKPFIGTNVGGMPEIIRSEKYGLIAEPGNFSDLADKILLSIEREWDRETILSYATNYSWENIGKEIVSVYRRVSGSAKIVIP
jgi:glycosyltransferase involved in cell wall biosynthesis